MPKIGTEFVIIEPVPGNDSVKYLVLLESRELTVEVEQTLLLALEKLLFSGERWLLRLFGEFLPNDLPPYRR